MLLEYLLLPLWGLGYGDMNRCTSLVTLLLFYEGTRWEKLS